MYINRGVGSVRDDGRELPSVWVAGKPRYFVRVPARGCLAVRVRYAQRVLGVHNEPRGTGGRRPAESRNGRTQAVF
ncbi:MAG: hypothetical protein HY927_15850 [Elusimicrobia bacterium]|nr:hypothetical protein [Elusimicrobiota bacterium]